MAALVLGLIGLVPVWGLVCAVLGIVFGFRARRRIRESHGHLGGGGMALTGIVSGFIGCIVPIVVILAAVVFVLVNNLAGSAGATHSETVTVQPGTEYLRAFAVSQPLAAVNYTYEASGGHSVTADLGPAVSRVDAHRSSTQTWAEASGSNARQSVTLPTGVYSLRLQCRSTVPCTIQYTFAVTALEDNGIVPPPPGSPPDCAPTEIPSGNDSALLTAWQPPVGAVPSGTYIYTESRKGDYIGAGGRQLYTPANDTIQVTQRGTVISVHAKAAWWGGEFQVPDRCPRPMVGYYTDLTRQSFSNPKFGGLDWSGQGRGCNTITGSMVIDSIQYDLDGTMTELTFRFEQHCEGGPNPLMGKVHWSVNGG